LISDRDSSIFENPPAEKIERGDGGNRQNSAKWRRNFQDLAPYLSPLVVIAHLAGIGAAGSKTFG